MNIEQIDRLKTERDDIKAMARMLQSSNAEKDTEIERLRQHIEAIEALDEQLHDAKLALAASQARGQHLREALNALIASLKENSDPWGCTIWQCEPEDYEKAVRVLQDSKCN